MALIINWIILDYWIIIQYWLFCLFDVDYLWIFDGWQPSCNTTCNAAAWPFSQPYCRSGATEELGEGHLANVWIFLLSHPPQGGVPPLGSYFFLECQSGIPPTRARWTPFGQPKSTCRHCSFVWVVQWRPNKFCSYTLFLCLIKSNKIKKLK